MIVLTRCTIGDKARSFLQVRIGLEMYQDLPKLKCASAIEALNGADVPRLFDHGDGAKLSLL